MSVEEQRLSLMRLMEQLPERAQKLRDDSEALLGQANKLAARVELLDAQANRLAYGLVGQATALSADMGTLNAIAHSIGDLVDWPPAGAAREVPVMGQRDGRWGSARLGTSPESIGGYGCAITCLAMVLQAFGLDETPLTVNAKLTQRNGYYQGNLLIWEAVQRIWPSVKFEGRVNSTPAPVERINRELAAGRPVIVWLDFSHEPGLQQHFVLLVEKMNRADGELDYWMHDPWHADRAALVGRYKQNLPGKPWFLKAEGIIQGARFYVPDGEGG